MKGQDLHSLLANDAAKVEGLLPVIETLAETAVMLWQKIQRAPFADILGSAGQTNVQGEEVQKLDELANTVIKEKLSALPAVAAMASEEDDEPTVFRESESLLVCVDPLDGSSNIDVNIPIGTIFSVRLRPQGSAVTAAAFLRPGTEQVAAGYFMYGAALTLMVTVGKGTHILTYDPDAGRFIAHAVRARIPEKGKIYSVNEGNSPQMPPAVRRYLRHCKSKETLAGKPYSLRYIGSLIGDFHRNFLKGGIFLYPPTESAPSGKLRLLYECAPMAFLAEQAGGAAWTGSRRVLEVRPEHIHQRVPFYTGSARMMEELKTFFT